MSIETNSEQKGRTQTHGYDASKGLQQACKYIGKDPETNIPKLMELVDKFAGDSYQSQRDAIRKVVNDPDSNWFRLICSL